MVEDVNGPVTGGQLYVVATPIGNLRDLSPRALDVLRDVEIIAAEDTRHTGRLLSHFGIGTPQIALHDHNEATVAAGLVEKICNGAAVALVSDAGTPLISDPGFRLVTSAIDAGIQPVAVPGPSAITAALSIAGLPTDQFVFAGFLPPREDARAQRLAELGNETRTVVAFESVHRIGATLKALATSLNDNRRVAVARELTKKFECVYRGTAQQLLAALDDATIVAKGEFVVMIEGAPKTANGNTDADPLLRELIALAPLKQAVAAAQRLTGRSRNELYQRALLLRGEEA